MKVHNEVYNYLDENSLKNIENHQDFGGKILGIEYNPEILNEHDKHIGRILLLNDSPKFSIDEYVEFRKDRIKLQPTKYNDEGNGLCLINPYWCRKYIPNPKIDVPVEVWLPKEERVITEIRKLNYDQFIANRMMQKKRGWPHIYVLAVENCVKLFSKGRGFALNSTVRNYIVNKKLTEKYWGRHNKFKAEFNGEWNRLFKEYHAKDLGFRQLHKANEKRRLKELDSKLIPFKKSVRNHSS